MARLLVLVRLAFSLTSPEERDLLNGFARAWSSTRGVGSEGMAPAWRRRDNRPKRLLRRVEDEGLSLDTPLSYP